MWTFVFLYVLGLNVYQLTGQEMSTQMYYAKLIVDETAIGNVTELLTVLVYGGKKLVDDLTMTTICDPVSANCICQPGYKWSEKVCETNKQCCGKDACTFSKASTHMCVSNTSVTMTGSLTLTSKNYFGCLSDEKSEVFQNCNNGLLQKMKTVYSTLRGFDTLKIKAYRSGSIIAEFEISIAYAVEPQDLINKTIILTKNLSASVYLRTAGIVILKMPENPVGYNSENDVTCTAQHLDIEPTWQLKGDNRDYVVNILNGTGSEITFQDKESRLRLKNITKLWAGEYTCVYTQKSNSYTISHVASGVMSVALLPNIEISTAPGYPLCENKTDEVKVKVSCEIDNSSEPYDVTFNGPSGSQVIIVKPGPGCQDGTCIYQAETLVSCKNKTHIPQLTCIFKNRLNQTRKASINVNFIYDGIYCAAEDDWENTKPTFIAEIKCKNSAGFRQRTCELKSGKAEWGNEYSGCVNEDLYNVLEKANIVDIGLGSIDENSANVLSLLENITKNTEAINSFSNINTAVDILYSLSEKLSQMGNKSAVNDLLESSSNLLEKPLSKSWQADNTANNTSLAERFLISFEHLIQITNLSDVPKKKNIDVASSICTNNSQCHNVAFNVSVYLESSDPGRVRTAAFQELDKYLPNNDSDYSPNSIVMSTTIQRKQLDSVKIRMTFPLLRPRPRNVNIKCVSWDNETKGWSENGCIWDGSSNEGGCVCNHLSSFAILMSKHPLEVPGLTEVTYVGLSISIISLTISLVIELIVWSTVVRTNSLYLRHTAHVNISLCLLVADCCFLASSRPKEISSVWCKSFVVLKHFCYLSMFFWMLCLSSTLLHQAVFLFHSVSKKNYLRFSLVLGYACPFLIVFITFMANNAGAEGLYFSHDTCWLIYSGLMKGSIYTFLIPVGIIVFINVFSMLVVIMKLLDHPKNAEKSYEKEKKAALTVMRSIILLTPVFGLTWIFGFGVIFLDLTHGNMAYAVNYAFTLLNAFQGLFILLTTCLGDKLTRDALLHHLKIKTLSSINDSTTKTDSTVKK